MVIHLQIDEVLAEALAAEPALDAPEYLERAALAALEGGQAPQEWELSLVITGDEQLHELNRQFLGIDASTDVLSFPSEEAGPDPDTGGVYLGDVILSYSRARQQAEAAGHPVQEELQLLVVHGVLHLLGFDHADDEEKARMWAVQSQILRSLGLSLRPPD